MRTIALAGCLSAVATFSSAAPAPAPSRPLALDEIQARARAQDLRVLAADAQLRALRAKYEQAAWAWFPKFETFISVAGPTPEARRLDPVTRPEGGYDEVTPASRMYDLNLGNAGIMVRVDAATALPVYTFGKLTALKEAARNGYVETLLGRRRYFPALQSKLNGALKNREEREAINAPIQGTAADIMKIAMLHIPPALEKAGLRARMLLQVHDELVLEVPKDELDRTAKLVQEVMASAYSLDIPLSTEARSGLNWGEMTVLQ